MSARIKAPVILTRYIYNENEHPRRPVLIDAMDIITVCRKYDDLCTQIFLPNAYVFEVCEPVADAINRVANAWEMAMHRMEKGA